jgi:hypothetical protein
MGEQAVPVWSAAPRHEPRSLCDTGGSPSLFLEKLSSYEGKTVDGLLFLCTGKPQMSSE